MNNVKAKINIVPNENVNIELSSEELEIMKKNLDVLHSQKVIQSYKMEMVITVSKE